MSRKLILTIFVVAAATLLLPHSATAASFNAGRIIDDTVFTNNTTMGVDAIQAFLASKVATCDTNGTQSAADWGYPKLTHAQFATQIKGWPGPPYTCLKDYSENGVSAAQLIYSLAQQYKINPQVLIVTLQKESSLVTDNWPLSSQYRTATGYGCPDSGPNNSANCSSSYYGFTNQLTWTAKMYRAVLNQSPTWYSPYIKGSNYIQYNPNAACGGTMVTIENWSTAALYDYTPYQPNVAALNAGYGLGDNCSAYGNRNFYLYFTSWFGTTSYNLIPVRSATAGSGVYLIENGFKRPFDSVEALYSHGYTWSNVLTVSDTVLDSFPTGSPLGLNMAAYNGKLIKTSTPNSGIYLVENGYKRPFDSAEAFYSYGYSWASVVTVSDTVMGAIPMGSAIGINITAYNGKNVRSGVSGSGVYRIENSTKRPFDSAEAFYSYGYSWADITILPDATIKKIPLGPVFNINLNAYNLRAIRNSASGSGVYLIENGFKRPFDSVEALYSHGYTWSNVLTVSDTVLDSFPTGSPLGLNMAAYNGKLIKTSTPNSGIYLVENGYKRPFDSAEAFYSYGYSWASVVTVSDTVMGAIPMGSAIGIRPLPPSS